MDVKYCPKCATELVLQTSGDRERPTCPACGFVFYFNPVVGAGALVETDGRVILVRRGAGPKMGRWSLPSGYVEADELAEQAAVREMREETGLEIVVDEMLGTYSFGKEPQTGVLLLYSGHPIGGELRAGDDAVEVCAFAPEELPADEEIAFRTHLEALRDWRRARAIIYRPATTADLAAITHLEECYNHNDDAFAGYLQDQQRRLLVAWDREVLVGAACVSLQARRRSGTIDQVFVHPNYRRWGIATRLVETTISSIRREDVRMLLAEAPVTNPVLLVYLKAGFRVSGFIDTHYVADEAGPTLALLLVYDLGD